MPQRSCVELARFGLSWDTARMKLRIRGNTVRLRLTQGELNQLVEKGSVEERTTFGPTAGEQLVYAIVTNASATAIVTTFLGGRLEIAVPQADARTWATTDQVGLEVEQTVSSADNLCVLIEKDFA